MYAGFVLLVSLVAYSQASTSCTGRCGSAYDPNQPCQCNDLCPNYNNCCSDYNTLCLGLSPGSCQGRCGSNLDNSQSCQCNSQCKQFNDCCGDYDSLCDGYIPQNQVEWRDILKEMWFNLYPRSNSNPVLDSSGFEHVLVGEEKSTSIGGFHNWIQFYLEEKAGRLDYTGWVSQALPRTVGSQFKWNGKWKGLGSFMVGVSPEFDVAVYSVCAIIKPNSICSFTLDGRAVSIQSYDIAHKSGIQLATAYVRS
ncbi:uridylate-specific endoribonuclease-like [Patella vulgata]|uniref:uridylate-specific endoribonuclease-like n=1 Tax=Patella vulgata TaxID=6465 RepID=UPI0024A8466C|nr:uridylate-specific endoribonuclease-like [Patella vulgata]